MSSITTLRAKLAAHERWAASSREERRAALAPAHAAFDDRFIRLAREQFGDLPPEELAARAANLRSAHFARMALKSAMVRRGRKSRARDVEGVETK